MIVTIDGPAGSGKSTAARGLAARLGFQFLDTGAMYRAVAWACLQEEIPYDDVPAVGELARRLDVSFSQGRVLADGRDVTDEIRTAEVTEGASVVAMNSEVRHRMTELQRKAAAGLNIVTEGRDQGTVVFPDAECKFFLTAAPQERARRRYREMHDRGIPVRVEEVLQQIHDRDERDETRAIGPLKPADDAVRIDTSEYSPEEVLDLLEQEVRTRLKLAAP